MRIRKNAKLSPLLFSCSSSSSSSSLLLQVPVETFQTHVCQLNQSPWDVIPFDSDSIQGSTPLHPHPKFPTFISPSSLNYVTLFSLPFISHCSPLSPLSARTRPPRKQCPLPKVEDTMMIADNKVVAARNKGVARRCVGVDEKGWPCKNEARQGQSLCQHHLSLFRSFNNNNGAGSKKAVTALGVPATGAGATSTTSRRHKPRPAAKKTAAAAAPTTSNPNEFYYYSGFGPLWGKRRGDRNGGEGGSNSRNSGCDGENLNSAMVVYEDNVAARDDDVVKVNNNNDNVRNVGSVSGMVDELEYEDDDDDDDDDQEEEDDSGKKRMRKPVKARSLKSLM
ncbi:hypothetical protein RJT34_15555 [Clitoria ternatea]|uniref:WRC domain-containing protein n=1 Tax=Clitoria ternatea TaxID=43366 RepID=A0AAN9J5U1_CLITE